MAGFDLTPLDAGGAHELECYEVLADTMAPTFRRGDSIFVDPFTEEKAGDFVCALLPNGVRVLRQLEEVAGARYFRAFDPVSARRVPRGTTIVGVVRQHHRTFA